MYHVNVSCFDVRNAQMLRKVFLVLVLLSRSYSLQNQLSNILTLLNVFSLSGSSSAARNAMYMASYMVSGRQYEKDLCLCCDTRKRQMFTFPIRTGFTSAQTTFSSRISVIPSGYKD